MPKLHFGSRGGVYTIKKGTKKYLKFGNYEIDEINFGDDAFADEGIHPKNRNKLTTLINSINSNNDIRKSKDIIELFSMLGYGEPGGDKLSTSYWYYINGDELEYKLSLFIGPYTIGDNYFIEILNGLESIIQRLQPNNSFNKRSI
jgi:hypothetical protein